MNLADKLNYAHLRYFWAVAHAGTVTAAAERLHVSQSAVSVQIKALAEAIGHDLFERHGRRLVLTEAGRIALDHADAIFAMGAELIGTLDARGEVNRRVLRVGALATLSRNFQLRFLRPLLGREDVEVVIQSGPFEHLIRNLEAHALDVVLCNFTPRRDAATRWVAHLIDEQPVSLVAGPASAARHVDLRRTLATEPLVLPAAESSIRAGFDALVARLDVRPIVAAEVDDMAMLRLVAREHIGMAVVPSIVVRDELDAGVLVEVEQLPGLEETFFAITLSRRFPNPLVAELLNADPGIGARRSSP
ncbi:MAG: LysR family transcriptional activator of nhaA [Bradymonadia bacterium]|jgi:LysR family transcriptional activator of nhaA